MRSIVILVLIALQADLPAQEPTRAALEARVLLLLDEYLLRADDRRAREIEREITSIDELDIATLERLLRSPMPRAKRPGGVQELEFELGGEGLRYTVSLLVPEDYDPTRFWPLLVAAHGTGGEETGPLRVLEPHARKAGMLVASLRECEARRDKGWGYSDEERRVQEDLVLALRRDYQIDPRRVYMMGWSRGGHASWDMALRRPGLLAGIGPIVGGVPARDLALLPNLVGGVRVDAVNGERDQPELVVAVREADARLAALGVEHRLFLDPARGHDPFEDRLGPMLDYLGAQARPAAPGRIAIASREKSVLRHDWLAIAGFETGLYRPGAKIVIPGVTRMKPEEQRAAWLAAVAAGTAFLEARVEAGNTIVLEARKVKRVRILLPPTGISLQDPVTIRLGEKTLRTARFRPDQKDLLRSAREARDPFMAYPAAVELSLR